MYFVSNLSDCLKPEKLQSRMVALQDKMGTFSYHPMLWSPLISVTESTGEAGRGKEAFKRKLQSQQHPVIRDRITRLKIPRGPA